MNVNLKFLLYSKNKNLMWWGAFTQSYYFNNFENLEAFISIYLSNKCKYFLTYLHSYSN